MSHMKKMARGYNMTFLTLLIILSGFAFLVFLGLVNIILDLSEMSAHVPPQMLSMPHRRGNGAVDRHAHESSGTSDLSSTQ